MTNWKITAGRGGVLAKDWLEKEIITIGWDIGNIEEMDDEEIREKSKDSQMTRFVGARDDGMEKGDLVIAYAPGRKIVIGVGEVVSDCYYKEDHNLEINHPYWRDVKWRELGCPVRLHDLPEDLQQGGDNEVFYRATLGEFKGENIHRVMEGVKKAPPVDLEDLKKDIFSPDSEEQVREYIYNNIGELGNYRNPKQEVTTSVGNVDVLAEKAEGEEEVAIEVKKGMASDAAVGQLLGYINALQEEGEKPVTGILVAEGFSGRVKRAVKSTNIQLVKFRMGLNFNRISS